jgi:hypothetical protein
MRHPDSFLLDKLSSQQIQYLRKLQAVGYESAIIAGGAIRDTYLKRKITDIDIFIQYPNYSNETIDREYRHLTDEQPVDRIFAGADSISTAFDRSFDKGVGEPYAYSSVSNVHVKNIMKDGVKYQFILTVKPPIQCVTEDFYLDLSRCYCDGRKLRYTQEFLKDAHNNTLTIAGSMNKEQYRYGLMHYLKKMKRKFPDYRIVDTLKSKFDKEEKRK